MAKKALMPTLAAALPALMAGCSITTTMYADEQLEPYLKSLTAERPDYPLARTLTWKYHYTVGEGKHQMAWLVADGDLVRDAKALAGVQMLPAQPSSAGVRMSDVYDLKASQASNNAQTQLYKGLSATSVRRVSLNYTTGGRT